MTVRPHPRVCDMHVHTRFSCDSQADLESYCQRALEAGVSAVCFTEHVDFNPADYGFGFYRPDAFFDEFKRMQDRYAGSVELLAGLEFSEPHVYRAEFEALARRPYDFIIGSVHYWYRGMFPSEMVKAGVPAAECFGPYWREVLSAARFGGFDCLGHIDFPKRYYKQLLYDPDEMSGIFDAMARNGIGLEINTSSLRKGLDEPMPGREMLALYAACGGSFLTAGSDAHSPGELASGFDIALRLAEDVGLSAAVFRGRKRADLRQDVTQEAIP